MSDQRRDRLERDVEDLLLRVRMLENLGSPAQVQGVSDFRETQRQVQRMDARGTSYGLQRFKEIDDDIRDLKEAQKDAQTQKAADRRVVLGSLLAAATALIMAGVGVLIQIVTRHP